jgi:hypothetical protein
MSYRYFLSAFFIISSFFVLSCNTGSSNSTNDLSTNDSLRDKDIILIWWNSEDEKEYYGEINDQSGEVTIKGTIGDLKWWSMQAYATDNTLMVIGMPDVSTNNKLYIIDLKTNKLVSQNQIGSPTLFNYVFASGSGKIIIWWNSEDEKEYYGEINDQSGEVTIKGTIGDLKWWSMQAYATDDTLMVIGMPDISTNNKLYIIDLKTNKLVSQNQIGSPTLFNYVFAH